MNFSYEAVRRIAGVLRSEKEYTAKEGQIRALDNSLGGDWWHDLAHSDDEGWVQSVLYEYAHRVSQAAKCGFMTAEVADSLEAQPVYELILFTPHDDGLWKMMEAMSTARQRWRQWLVDRREQANSGQAELRGLDWDDNEDAWIEEIAKNLRVILGEKDSFVLHAELGRIMGRTLGLARTKHIRSALKQLRAEKLINADPKGELQRFCISRK